MNRFYPRLKILFAEPLSDFTKGFLPQIIHDGTDNLFNYQEKLTNNLQTILSTAVDNSKSLH